jgi:hypothetical protein
MNDTKDKRQQIADNAAAKELAALKAELKSLKRDHAEVLEVTNTEAIAEGLMAKVAVLNSTTKLEYLLDDKDSLETFIEEAQALVKGAKFLNKLLDKQGD